MTPILSVITTFVYEPLCITVTLSSPEAEACVASNILATPSDASFMALPVSEIGPPLFPPLFPPLLPPWPPDFLVFFLAVCPEGSVRLMGSLSQ